MLTPDLSVPVDLDIFVLWQARRPTPPLQAAADAGRASARQHTNDAHGILLSLYVMCAVVCIFPFFSKAVIANFVQAFESSILALGGTE